MLSRLFGGSGGRRKKSSGAGKSGRKDRRTRGVHSRGVHLRGELLEDRRVLSATVLLNEIKANPPGGSDNRYEYVELTGTPGASLNNLWFVTFNGTSSENPGVADMVFNLSSYSLGSNGLAVLKSSTGGHSIPAPTVLIPDDSFFTKSGGFDAGALSFFLFSSPNPFVAGADYDTNNDGVLDNLPAGATVVDSVDIRNTNSGTSSDKLYGSVIINDVVNTGTPDAVTRFLGTTSTATSSWYGGELFDTGNVAATVLYDVTRPGTNMPSGATLTPGTANYPTPAAPVLTASVSSLSYNQGASATVIDPHMTLTDGIVTNVSSATISLASQPGGAVLGFTNTATITGVFSGTTLTLSGVDTVADYQAALESVTYRQTTFSAASGGPVQFVVNDGINNSNSVQIGVTVVPSDQAPSLSGPATASVIHGQSLAFTGGNAITVSDSDASGPETVGLSVGGGTMNVSLAGGATISAGANGAAALTLRGTIAQLNAALATLVYNAPNTGASDTLTALANDGQLNSNTLSVAIALENVPATVVGRYIFYKGSQFDTASDNAAIATDKTALLPGQTATFANYTSYSLGINGIMVDIANLPAGTTTLSAADFAFHVGNDSTPSGWALGPNPISILVGASGSGANGSTRVELLWADGAIVNQWLEVQVLADVKTGLATADAFYFGNAVGETGNSASDASVGPVDVASAVGDPHGPFNRAAITDVNDFNRDGQVNATDVILARDNATTVGTALQLISPPDSQGGHTMQSDLATSPAQTAADLSPLSGGGSTASGNGAAAATAHQPTAKAAEKSGHEGARPSQRLLSPSRSIQNVVLPAKSTAPTSQPAAQALGLAASAVSSPLLHPSAVAAVLGGVEQGNSLSRLSSRGVPFSSGDSAASSGGDELDQLLHLLATEQQRGPHSRTNEKG